MASLRLERLGKSFGAVTALDELSLEVGEGELVSLLGPSGSGKTTALRLIAGYETPTRGEVYLSGRAVGRLPPERRDIGMVFQNYALFRHLTVFDNVAFGLRMRRVGGAELRRRVNEALAMVRLERLDRRLPRQLSGGQQQRVALARAIAYRPALLLLDEPLSALDRELRARMQVDLHRLQRETGLTTLYVTHDQEEALALSDRVAVLNGGRLQQLGAPRAIYEQPANAFVAGFIGVANLFEAELLPGGPDGPRLRIGAHTCPLAPLGELFRPGPARVALRPERSRLDPAPTPGALPGAVTGSVYLGTTTHVHVALEGGPSLVAFVQNTTPAAATFGVGARVWASWDPASPRIVRE